MAEPRFRNFVNRASISEFCKSSLDSEIEINFSIEPRFFNRGSFLHLRLVFKKERKKEREKEGKKERKKGRKKERKRKRIPQVEKLIIKIHMLL